MKILPRRYTDTWEHWCQIIDLVLFSITWHSFYALYEYILLPTCVNSRCKCPSNGNALAFSTLGGAFDGPGPIRSFCGNDIDFNKLAGGGDMILMLAFCCNTKTLPDILFTNKQLLSEVSPLRTNMLLSKVT